MPTGQTPPSTIEVGGDCHSIYSYTPYASPNYSEPIYNVPTPDCFCL